MYNMKSLRNIKLSTITSQHFLGITLGMLILVGSASLSFADTPRQQLAEGVEPKDIQCGESLVLFLRDNGAPICIQSSHIEAFTERGLGMVQTSNIKLLEKSDDTKSNSLFTNSDGILVWASEPTYLPGGYELKTIDSAQNAYTYLNYGTDPLKINDTVRDNIANGIVVLYNEDKGSFGDWNGWIQGQAFESEQKRISKIGDASILLLDNVFGTNKALYLDGSHSISVLSDDVPIEELEKILISIIS